MLTPSLVVEKIIWESSYSTVRGILNLTGSCLDPANYPANTPKKQLSTPQSNIRMEKNWGCDAEMHLGVPKTSKKEDIDAQSSFPTGVRDVKSPLIYRQSRQKFPLDFRKRGSLSKFGISARKKERRRRQLFIQSRGKGSSASQNSHFSILH